MNVRRFSACAACFVLLAGLASAGMSRSTRTSVTVSTEDDRPLDRCDQIQIRFGDESDPLPMARAEETLESTTPSLRAALGESQSIAVRGWDEDRTSVRVCKAAGARSDAEAQKALDSISVKLEGGILSVDGPDEPNWVVYLLAQVPRKARVDLEAKNGGISVEGISGGVRSRTQNGPVEVRDCSGTINVHAENGPIDLVGKSGNASLDAQNGPISVVLEGTRWEGEGLEARTENGPVSLKLPRDYGSGVDVRSTGHSPISCRALQCDGARKTWAEELRRVELGASPAVVRLSTVNGPVSVEPNGPRRKVI